MVSGLLKSLLRLLSRAVFRSVKIGIEVFEFVGAVANSAEDGRNQISIVVDEPCQLTAATKRVCTPSKRHQICYDVICQY